MDQCQGQCLDVKTKTMTILISYYDKKIEVAQIYKPMQQKADMTEQAKRLNNRTKQLY